MSTKGLTDALYELGLRAMREGNGALYDVLGKARDELEAIEKAALDLVAWNDNGQSGIDVAAARGFGVLERIAAEAKARQG